MNDDIPVCGHHRGVPLHAGQSPARLKVVKRDIDHVLDKIHDAAKLLNYAHDPSHAPESRLLAASKCKAGIEQARQERRTLPRGCTLEKLEAAIAGVGSRSCQSPDFYCSDLDSLVEVHEGRGPVRREKPLAG